MNEKEKHNIKKNAIEEAVTLKKQADKGEGGSILEYTPVGFKVTEIDNMLEVCNAVLDVWKPTPDKKASIVIPIAFWSTMPYAFACRVEYMYKHLKYRDSVILSMYPHGDHTDNADKISITINLNCHAVETGPNLSNLCADNLTVNTLAGFEVNKGDAAFILKQHYGISLPKTMQEDVNSLIDGMDESHHDLTTENIYRIFENTYINNTSIYDISECHFVQKEGIVAKVTIVQDTETHTIMTMGNGRLDAVSNAVKMYFGIDYELASYEEHAISSGSTSKAATFVSVVSDGIVYWGVGIDEDIIKSSVEALVSATNKLLVDVHITEGREERIVNIMNYIQNHYQNVTLDVLVEQFHLTKPYLSKYIKMKSGMTFQEAVRDIRMKKARILLKESSQTVESIAATVGYENVEHFNRLFKRMYNMTPSQYQRKGR